jgi:hypothetical protein
MDSMLYLLDYKLAALLCSPRGKRVRGLPRIGLERFSPLESPPLRVGFLFTSKFGLAFLDYASFPSRSIHSSQILLEKVRSTLTKPKNRTRQDSISRVT